ncbi:ThuA domain-containing protein [Cellulomonas alba]|uniref:ThuA domain-containing protein n=1 Tax=Cellulomonas alba TaxID=3053467 RepID=A0ABT7SE40_9CELL|nr:ThuA domain-containing protein [Cellulomonas alba]MDM7854450.1 ThuA domain-containing protein [Cellulomonas alba]
MAPVTDAALVLVGQGRYADPWHDVAATSHALAALLADVGLPVDVRGTRPDALGGLDAPGLLVVVAGDGRRDAEFDGDDDAWRGFHDRRADWVAEGVPVLAVHQSAMAFRDDPRWAREVGGRWVEDRSWHPPLGPAVLRVAGDPHPVTAGLGPLAVVDERYADLEVDPGVRPLVLADVTADEASDRPVSAGAHPVVWVAPGPGRVLYDALGHDVRSFESPDHRALLTAAIGWLLAL